ncbi:MAG: alpha/beta fold hydrolase [bacterium]
MDASWVDSRRLSRRLRRPPGGDTEIPGIRHLDCDLARVRLLVRGSGPWTVVLAADPPNVIEHHLELIELLAQDLRVICLELPGFGFSFPKKEYRFTIDDIASVLDQLLTRLDMKPYVLALSCVAGLAALKLAHDRPDLAARLVTIQTPARDEAVKWARRVDFKGVLATPYVGQIVAAAGKDRLAAGWYRAVLGETESRAYLARARESFRHGAVYCLASAFQALKRPETAELSRLAVTQPALCVWGAADRSHRRTDRASILRNTPGGRLVEIEGAGHFPELEEAARFRRHLLEFLGMSEGNRT